MKIEELLKTLNEEEITVEKAKQMLIDELDLDEIELEDVKESVIKSAYNEYKCFGNSSYVVIKYEDFKDYTYDLANELAQKLPDKFDVYFNTEELAKDMLDEFVLVKQTQQWLDDLGESVDLIEEIYSADNNCYILELY